MIDLSLVSMKDLITEIKKRRDSVVIGAFQPKTKEAGEILIDWEGEMAQTVLLCELLKQDILDYYIKGKRDPDE